MSISEMLAAGTLGEGCASFFLSKILGSCVLLGSLAFKVPQILKIHTNKSAAGVSISQFWMELCVSAMSLSFNYHIGAPFTTYGESFFILAQNVIIVFQIRFFSKMPWAKFGAIWILYLTLLTFLFSQFAKNLQVPANRMPARCHACAWGPRAHEHTRVRAQTRTRTRTNTPDAREAPRHAYARTRTHTRARAIAHRADAIVRRVAVPANAT